MQRTRLDEALDPKQKTAVVMELLRKDLKPREICDRYGLDMHQLAGWVFRFVTAGQQAMEEDEFVLN